MSDSKTTTSATKTHVVRSRGQTPAPAGTEAANSAESAAKPSTGAATNRPKEIGGPKGPEPTRYGDWERGGRCVDF